MCDNLGRFQSMSMLLYRAFCGTLLMLLPFGENIGFKTALFIDLTMFNVDLNCHHFHWSLISCFAGLSSFI